MSIHADPKKPTKVYINPKKNVENRVNTYKAGRTLTISGEKRWAGELVPEAHTWLRVGNLEHTGYLENVQVSEAEFDDAVEKYCPDLTETLAWKAKGYPVAKEDDTKFTGFRTDEEGNVIDVAAQRALERERERANTPPNERVAADHSGGTPQYVEEHTPDNVHSDGGTTTWIETGDKDGFEAYVDPDTRPGDLVDEDDDSNQSSTKPSARKSPAKKAPAKKSNK